MAGRAVLYAFVLALPLSAARAERAVPEEAADVTRVGALEIVEPWAFRTVGATHAVQVFFVAHNHGDVADSLIAAHSPLARGATVLQAPGGRTVADITIPAGGAPYELAAAGYRIELAGFTLPLTMGKRFPVTLEFKHAGRVTVEVTSRFHAPDLGRRIRAAIRRGDTRALEALAPAPSSVAAPR